MGFFRLRWIRTTRTQQDRAPMFCVSSVCRDLQQLPLLRGDMPRRDLRRLERHTFDRLMMHIRTCLLCPTESTMQ